MTTPHTRLRIALIQVRAHRASMMQEQSCFIERCRIARQRFTFINLVHTPNVGWRDVEDSHAVIIGGAGAFSVTDAGQPFTAPMTDLVHEIIDRDRPLMGVCWGHQFLIKHTGGTVTTDPEQAEIGTYAANLTPAGRADPLFEDCPSPFWVQLGHKDSAGGLGPGWRELAYSDRSRYQAVRLDDKPVYGTQFHTDLNEERLRERLHVYFDDYVEDEEDYERILRSLRPSIDADRLLERFLDLYA